MLAAAADGGNKSFSGVIPDYATQNVELAFVLAATDRTQGEQS
jgi:hypothetical protein